MKMSEWFDLPMDVSNEDREPLLADKNYYISSFCDVLSYQDCKGTKRAEAAAHAINCHDELVAMIDSLASELNLVIDELNTMRDIHHRDPLTPADHWDKELLHDVQLSLAKIRGDL